MQNETFEFTFFDKSDVDEKSFFLWFLTHLSRPDEKPKSPLIECAIAAFNPECNHRTYEECTHIEKKEYSPTPGTSYSAAYTHSTGRLDVNVLTVDNDPEATPGTLHIRSHEGDTTTVVEGLDSAMRYEPLAGDAWDVFYRHATFNEILDSIAPDGGDSVLVKVCRFEACNDDDEKAKLALQIIRDDPKWLLNEKVAVELIETLEKARWSTDRKEATEAMRLLKEHLLPVRHGGRIPLPPNINSIKAILEALSKHLSERCRVGIDAIDAGLERGKGFNDYLYRGLYKWAEENNEFRISRLPRNELNSLILKPKAYANDLLKARLRTSVKTIRRKNA